MQKLHVAIKNFILNFVDAFYPLFKRVMPLQTFRYAACGGGNMLLDIVIFFISYNFILQKKIVDLGFTAISPHIFSLAISFCVTFPVGFYLSRYVVWQQTETSKRVQLFRYLLVVFVCIFMNYIFMKVFVDYLQWWPTFSKAITTIFVTTFSYFTQRHFSFREAT